MARKLRIKRKENRIILSKKSGSIILGLFLLVFAGIGGAFLYFWQFFFNQNAAEADLGRMMNVADITVYGSFFLLFLLVLRAIYSIFLTEVISITNSDLVYQKLPFGFPKKKSVLGGQNFYIKDQDRYPYHRGNFFYHVGIGDPISENFLIKNILDEELAEAVVQELNSRTSIA